MEKLTKFQKDVLAVIPSTKEEGLRRREIARQVYLAPVSAPQLGAISKVLWRLKFNALIKEGFIPHKGLIYYQLETED